MTESEARAALLEMGIKNPSRPLLENFASANGAQESAQESTDEQSDETPPLPSSSKSNLKPLLLERSELQRPAGRRKPGRPSVIAPWFEPLARLMSNGTPLRAALSRLEIHGLTEREIRALYRNRALTAMRQEARQKWQREWGLARSGRRKTTGCKGCGLGLSQEFLRSL